MGLTLNRGREAADGPWSSSQEAACRPARPEFHYGHARAAAVSMRQRAADASPALKFVLMVGVMSFFADFTYEGARSITGPYLGLLGAGAFAISVISGTGEFLGYNIRLLSGRGADRTGPVLAGHDRRVHTADVGGAAARPGRKLAGGGAADHCRADWQGNTESAEGRDAVPRRQGHWVRAGVRGCAGIADRWRRWRTRCWSSPAAWWSPVTAAGSWIGSRPTSWPGKARRTGSGSKGISRPTKKTRRAGLAMGRFARTASPTASSPAEWRGSGHGRTSSISAVPWAWWSGKPSPPGKKVYFHFMKSIASFRWPT